MEEKGKGGAAWNVALKHHRSPVAKLKRLGDEVIQAENSANTVSDVQNDHQILLDEVRQLDHYVLIKTQRNQTITAYQVIQACSQLRCLFGDGTFVGYATHYDIEEFLKNRPSNFDFARNLLGKALKLQRSTIDTLLKPSRKKK